MGMIGNFLAVSQGDLDSLYANPEAVSTFIYETHLEDTVDTDKAWQGIHFLLTGTAYGGTGPLSHAIFGGREIGAEDVGYGPARGLSLAEVSDIAAALSAISEADFRAKFDASALISADVYPQNWENGDADLDYLAHHFCKVKLFYAQAAENQLAAILFIG